MLPRPTISIKSTQPSVGPNPAPPPTPEPEPDRARALMTEFSTQIADFHEARKSKAAFDRLSAEPMYPKLVAELRKLAVEALARGETSDARFALRAVAKALDVPLADLEMLARVPSDIIASGHWRPRSVNIDLIENDVSTTLGQTDAQRRLNEFAKRSVPKVRTVTVPGLAPVYHFVGRSMREVERRADTLVQPLDDLGRLVCSWSDAVSSDVSQRLLRVHRAIQVSGLRPSDLGKLSKDEQHAVLLAGQAISGAMLDAHKFVHRQRVDPRGAREILHDWTASGVRWLGHTLRALADTIHHATSTEEWDAFAMHLVLNGRLGKKGVIGTGPAVTILFPTLEQVRRTGKAEVRLVPRVVLFDTPAGGLCASARGGETRARMWVLSAQIAAYEHHITVGPPNWVSMDIGEDYSYGPLLSLAKSRPVAPCFLPGFELIVFHPVIGRLSKPARRAAEAISTGYDDAQRWIGRHRPRRKSHPAPTKIAVGEDGLPLQQRWNLARRKLERARAAQHRAEHYLGIWGSPDALLLAANAHALEPLGYEAQRAPLRTYAIIHGFLENLIAGIERDACALERLGKNAAAGRPTSMSEIKKTARALERRAEAFEFVDIALSEIVDESLEKGGAS